MAELITAPLMAEQLQQLLLNWPRGLAGRELRATADLYFQRLQGVSADALRFAVTRIIQEDEYFPKVARIRELAREHQQRTNAVLPARVVESPDVCSVCGARAQPREIVRWKRRHEVKVGDDGRRRESYPLELDEHGKPQLERVTSLSWTMVHDAAAHGIRPTTEDEL